MKEAKRKRQFFRHYMPFVAAVNAHTALNIFKINNFPVSLCNHENFYAHTDTLMQHARARTHTKRRKFYICTQKRVFYYILIKKNNLLQCFDKMPR